MRRRARSAAMAGAALLAALVVASAACSSNDGFLVVAITSDMTTPKDLDAFAVLVESAGSVKYDYVGFPPPRGTMALPATLVVPQPADPSAEVHVRVVGFRAGDARVVRDAITTVPEGRDALLRMPLEYLDDGSARGALPASLAAGTSEGAVAAGDFDPRAIGSTCDFARRLTSVDGACASAVIDAASLPDYAASDVFGAGGCFDVAGCFAASTPVTGLDTAACALSASSAAGPFALATHDGTGGCTSDGRCFVPLDDGDVADATDAGGLTFVPGVCAKVAAGDRLYAGGGCPAKSPSAEVCAVAGSAPADGGVDGTLADAGPRDGAPDVVGDGPDCVSVVGALLRGTTTPPRLFAGIDLSNDGGADGSFGGGGSTLGADLLACADSVEPGAIASGAPVMPGYRQVVLGAKADPLRRSPIAIEVNAESRVPYLVRLSRGYTGHVAFHSRSGGAYGNHTYDLSIESAFDSRDGPVLRDGLPLTADWNTPSVNGVAHASAFINEIYDGLMATFDPATPAVSDCYSTPFSTYDPGEVFPVTAPSCDIVFNDGASASTIGVRPLHLSLSFDVGTNQVSALRASWLGGVTACNTPQANVERMDLVGLHPVHAGFDDAGNPANGVAIGGAATVPGLANPAGLTQAEANAVFCNGVSVPAPDPGYAMMQWGPKGEIAMESNAKTGVNYKLFARAGYPGKLVDLSIPLDDGGLDDTLVKMGTLLHNGAPIAIDWTSVTKASAAITPVSNAWFSIWCGTAALDGDCVSSGNCTITPDDGAGGSSFVLTAGPNIVFTCGITVQSLGFVFAKGTSTLTEVYAINPGGQ